MPNHIHIIWQIQDKYQKASVQQSFLKYTAQQIKLTMLTGGNKELEKYKVKASDRQYQFWERKPLSIDFRPAGVSSKGFVGGRGTPACCTSSS